MTYSTKYTTGLVTASEGGLESFPKFLPRSPKTGVQFVHGAGSRAEYNISPLGNQGELTRLVTQAGYVGYSGDNGGEQTWGNPTSLARMTANYSYQMTMPGVKASSGKIALVSASMGGLNSLNWAAANPSKVSCLVTVIPVLNVTDIVTNNRVGYASYANAAYSGGWSEATYGAAHNPFTMAGRGKFAGLPMLMFYGLTDALCLPTWVDQMAAMSGMNITKVPIPTGHDYDTYAAVDHERIVRFLDQYA